MVRRLDGAMGAFAGWMLRTRSSNPSVWLALMLERERLNRITERCSASAVLLGWSGVHLWLLSRPDPTITPVEIYCP